MSYEYIFCPFCGGSLWITDRTQRVTTSSGGKITHNKCDSCKAFSYSNISVPVEHPLLFAITESKRLQVTAWILPYKIIVNYLDNFTEFYELDGGKFILKINQAVNFDWYKNEELVEKIKKYVVFS